MGDRRSAALAIVVWVAVSVLLLSAASAGSSPLRAAPGAAQGSIVVAATADFGYEPDTFEMVPTNATITVVFTDNDPANMAHTFNLSSREGFVIPNSDSAAQLNALFAAYPAQVAITVSFLGDQQTRTFHSPAAPGWYEFVCNVSGHFQDGMYGFVAFGENLPPNVTGLTRVGVGGTAFSPFEAVSIGALALVLVLGLALWWRSRRPRSPPPVSHDRPRGPQQPRFD
jgi:uncharacterized cupredoxin-like copper-binding protein